MKNILLLILCSLSLLSCNAKKSNYEIRIDKDTCFVENNSLDSKILNEFTDASFHHLNKSSLKREARIIETPYSENKDTLITFSNANESYTFLYVTDLKKVIFDHISINYNNKYKDEIGFYNRIRDLISALDNHCDVTILSTETQMTSLTVRRENNRIKHLEFVINEIFEDLSAEEDTD